MRFRGGGDIGQPKIAWRRPTLIEAFLAGCCIFTLSMMLRVLWGALMDQQADYENAFFHASYFGVGYMIAGLLFKTRMVVLR